MSSQESRDTFGQKLASFRREAEYTQEEMAEKLNVTRQAVSNWERDINQPDISMLQNICILFGKNMDDIMRGVFHMNDAMEKADIQKGKGFDKYHLAVGLFYAAGLFLGLGIFFTGGLLAMALQGEAGAAYGWAASLFAGASVFLVFGLTAHAVITLKRKDR